MKIIKDGGHRLFETDPETMKYVSSMIESLRRRGLDAVREFSTKFDEWSPASFELTSAEIEEAVAKCSDQLKAGTAFCQGNVRTFAQAQMATLRPLEFESRPRVWLGHRHIPVRGVGSYVLGGRYPMFGSQASLSSRSVS